MSESSTPPTELIPQKEDNVQTVASEQGNPFHGFDWGDHLITVESTQRRVAKVGLIATSKHVPGPWTVVWDTPPRLSAQLWGTVIMQEVWRLAKEHRLPFSSIHNFQMKAPDDSVFDLISVGIDVCIPVDNKDDAQAFVERCCDMLASHQLEDTVVQESHSEFWGGFFAR